MKGLRGSTMVALNLNSEKLKPETAFQSKNLSCNDPDLGEGCMAIIPSTMHSEMMAIQSAISLSKSVGCGSARSVILMQKPGSYEFSGRDKR